MKYNIAFFGYLNRFRAQWMNCIVRNYALGGAHYQLIKWHMGKNSVCNEKVSKFNGVLSDKYLNTSHMGIYEKYIFIVY